MKRAQIVIIALANSPKIKVILDRLSHDNSMPIHILLATTPDEIKIAQNSSYSSLSMIEIAIASSHDRARQFALEQDHDWTLILEEDAIPLTKMQSVLSFYTLIDAYFPKKPPIAIHFSPEQFGILKKRMNEPFYRVVMLPDCAVAYALNREALSFYNSSPKNLSEVADWPRSLRKITWLTPLESMFAHPNVDNESSSTISERQMRALSRNKLQIVLSAQVLKTIRFLVLSLFSQKFGSGYVENDRFRTRIRPHF